MDAAPYASEDVVRDGVSRAGAVFEGEPSNCYASINALLAEEGLRLAWFGGASRRPGFRAVPIDQTAAQLRHAEWAAEPQFAGLDGPARKDFLVELL